MYISGKFPANSEADELQQYDEWLSGLLGFDWTGAVGRHGREAASP